MAAADRLIRALRAVLPSPFAIAVVLTVVTFLLAFLLTGNDTAPGPRAMALLGHWEQGLWNPPLLVFTVQMMLILVLGHVIALSRPVERIIRLALFSCRDTASSAATVALFTLVVSLFNWGLGVVFGAIFARRVAEHAVRRNFGLNYGLIGAAGYAGMMVWHGGISGSAPIKAAEAGHLRTLMSGLLPDERIALLPERIGFEATVFAGPNLATSAVLLLAIPLLFWLMGRRDRSAVPQLPSSSLLHAEQELPPQGAERLDRSPIAAWLFGGFILIYGAYTSMARFGTEGFAFITPDRINLLLLGLGIVLHGSFARFLAAVDEAVHAAAGILVQFPLYFGIMGIMRGSGMVQLFSDGLMANATATTFPLFTFLSAAVVNVFVPSGGGQWAVQGPIIMQAAEGLGGSLPKSIMALAYGDQLTNMLQPFWALPLLGITGLKAKDILPYALVVMALGAVVFVGALVMW
jgi:short-chain fatty acids transporter